MFRIVFQAFYKHLEEYLLLSSLELFISISREAPDTSAKQVSKALELGESAEGKKADCTASLVMWDAEGTNCPSRRQQISNATRQNKETTFPSYIE